MSGFRRLFSGNPEYLSQEQIIANMQQAVGSLWQDHYRTLLAALELEALRTLWSNRSTWESILLENPRVFQNLIQLNKENMYQVFHPRHTATNFASAVWELLEIQSSSRHYVPLRAPVGVTRGAGYLPETGPSTSAHAADYMPGGSFQAPRSREPGYLPGTSARSHHPVAGYTPATSAFGPQSAPSQYLPSGGPQLQQQPRQTQQSYQPAQPTGSLAHKPKPF